MTLQNASPKKMAQNEQSRAATDAPDGFFDGLLQVKCNSEWDGLRIAIDTSATEPWVKNLSYTWD